jgi:rhomboid protease GluP
MFGEKKKLVMCQNCRALVDPSESVCPMCGNEAVPERRVSVSRASGNFFSMLILGINVIIFVLMIAAGMKNGLGIDSFIRGAPSNVLIDFGSLHPFFVRQGEWWRIVTANFLHIGVIHLLFNSYALYQVGPLAEDIYGEQKFVFSYLLTGIVAFTASFILGIPSAGASGAISGIIGLMAAYGFRQGGTFGKALMRSMLTWMGMTIVMGFMIGANNVAHIGGFLAGGALGFLLKGDHPTTASSARVWNALALASVLILISSFVMVGKHYGSMQEQVQKEQELSRQAQNVIRLSRAMGDAEDALDDSNNLNDKSNLADVAKNLRKNATDISSIEKIDEPSDEIRNRLVALLTRRAEALDKAAKKPGQALVFLPEERREIDAAFRDYVAWEDSVLDKYGLVKTKKE